MDCATTECQEPAWRTYRLPPFWRELHLCQGCNEALMREFDEACPGEPNSGVCWQRYSA